MTLTAGTLHPILKKQIPLAIMETENIKLFWNLFNKSFKKTAGDKAVSYKPTGWSTDMAGTNVNGLRKVFGEDAFFCIKSSEFHLKES